jgi:hypothetical protein
VYCLALGVTVQVANRLFDVNIVAADGEVPVWHPDVRFFKVMQGDQPRAYFYLDPYSRPAEKRGGAWMAEVGASMGGGLPDSVLERSQHFSEPRCGLGICLPEVRGAPFQGERFT